MDNDKFIDLLTPRLKNEKFIDLLKERLQDSIKQRDSFDSSSPMYFYYDGKVVAFQAALDYFELVNIEI